MFVWYSHLVKLSEHSQHKDPSKTMQVIKSIPNHRHQKSPRTPLQPPCSWGGSDGTSHLKMLEDNGFLLKFTFSKGFFGFEGCNRFHGIISEGFLCWLMLVKLMLGKPQFRKKMAFHYTWIWFQHRPFCFFFSTQEKWTLATNRGLMVCDKISWRRIATMPWLMMGKKKRRRFVGDLPDWWWFQTKQKKKHPGFICSNLFKNKIL